MSNWNRAYLDALEVPVWVPLNDQGTENSAAETSNQSAETTESVSGDGLTYNLIAGQSDASLVFVVSEDLASKVISETLRQLQIGVKQWIEQPMSAAVVQVESTGRQQSEARQSGTRQLVELDSIQGQLIDCRQAEEQQTEKLEQPSVIGSVKGPIFDLTKANKKDWWLLLQRLFQ